MGESVSHFSNKGSHHLAQKVDVAVDSAAEELMSFLMSSWQFRSFKKLQELALQTANLSAERLEWLSENDDNSPQYQLYWAELCNLVTKVLARTIDKQSF